ncbi:MAG: xylulokinase [Tepidisphaerales bacterium]
MAILLGIDIGTSATKTLLLDDKGKVLATALSEYELRSPKPGWYEQQPHDDWWNAVCAATQAVMKKAKLKPAAVSAIGLSGQMHGSVFLDAKGRSLRPALLWNDQRTAEECAEIEAAAGGREGLVKLVANPALTGFTAPKILWLRKNEPKRYELTRQILLPKDFVRFQMTGEYATEVSDASGTLLLDVGKRDWSTELLSKLKIDKSLLPKVYESTTVTGKLTKEAADHLGLAPGIPVVGGAGDVAAGAVGNGIVRSGQLASIIGTSGIIFAHTDQMAHDAKGRVHTMCHAVPGKWCVFGCMLSGGGSLQWFRDTLGQEEVAAAKKAKTSPYVLLSKLAESAPVGCEGLIFLPYLTGERCPYNDPFAKGAFIGLTRRTTRAMMARAVMEGVCFGMRDLLEIIRAMRIPTDSLRATGGGAKSELWLQLQADIFRLPTALTNSDEGPALGVAILAGVGIGVWKSVEEACSALISETKVLKPRSREAKVYDASHAVYRQLYPALKDLFPRMGTP